MSNCHILTVNASLADAVTRPLSLMLSFFFSIRKLLNLKLFENSEGKRWGSSVSELKLELLCISQVCIFCISQPYISERAIFHISVYLACQCEEE